MDKIKIILIGNLLLVNMAVAIIVGFLLGLGVGTMSTLPCLIGTVISIIMVKVNEPLKNDRTTK